jgi:hypothetical protein
LPASFGLITAKVWAKIFYNLKAIDVKIKNHFSNPLPISPNHAGKITL